MKQDLRTLTKDGREQLRLIAIRMHNQGNTQEVIAETIGCSSKSIFNWLKDYKRYGKPGLKELTRGRKHGEKRSLTKQQEQDIKKLITDKYPDQLKFPFALWTGPAVQQLILDRYGYKMPIRTVRDFLKRWGFTPQKPIKRAYEQQPEQVKKWLTEQYPAIAAKAKQENAEIHWCDETGLSSEDNRGRGYSPKGKTPISYKTGKRFSTSMISAINNMGKIRFMIYKGGMNIEIFIQFLRRVIKDANRKIFLIVDNLKVHHAKKVQQWVGNHSQQIELFFLPAYSPEYNPDEYVNQDIKQAMRKKSAPKSEKEMTSSLRGYLRCLQKRPGKIRNFFLHEKVRYALSA